MARERKKYSLYVPHTNQPRAQNYLVFRSLSLVVCLHTRQPLLFFALRISFGCFVVVVVVVALFAASFACTRSKEHKHIEAKKRDWFTKRKNWVSTQTSTTDTPVFLLRLGVCVRDPTRDADFDGCCLYCRVYAKRKLVTKELTKENAQTNTQRKATDEWMRKRFRFSFSFASALAEDKWHEIVNKADAMNVERNRVPALNNNESK